MTKRILFVDDEPSILSGIERRLGTQYDLYTACCGEEGLELMATRGPFAVIVTDMRMPSMDGIQFIRRARQCDPNAVCIMLTGNQDQHTAVQAVNEGQVFRFLNKPCENAELKRAIDAAQRQYELVTSEKELLNDTLYGAVGVLIDVLELSHSEVFSRSSRVESLVANLRTSLQIEDCWEYKFASRLSLLGFALLPESDRQGSQAGSLHDPLSDHSMQKAADMGRRLIERIPRLENVARMIGEIPNVDGSLTRQSTKASEVLCGATLIRVALEWDRYSQQGYSPSAMLRELRLSLPNLDARLAEAVLELPNQTDEMRAEAVAPSLLCEGMILAEDFVSNDGLMLLRKGRKLTGVVIEKLRCYQPLQSIRVVEVRNQPDSELVCV